MIALVGLSAFSQSACAGQVIVGNLNLSPPPDTFTSQIDPEFTWRKNSIRMARSLCKASWPVWVTF